MTPNLLAKERHTKCLEGAMSKDGGGKGKLNPTKDPGRWNTGLQTFAFYSALCKITWSLH